MTDNYADESTVEHDDAEYIRILESQLDTMGKQLAALMEKEKKYFLLMMEYQLKWEKAEEQLAAVTAERDALKKGEE